MKTKMQMNLRRGNHSGKYIKEGRYRPASEKPLELLLLARQQNVVGIAFRWRADTGSRSCTALDIVQFGAIQHEDHYGVN